ncbi:SAM-dependent methyltransferase [Cryptosporangium phraense]|uniref:SAM-dependent methyltransferase n=2 Tax=Cryptosporangium phraense TaxID=2593070 RepID=A0A545AP64_9ACTN|nr:SAM-dependent methyltransferase [Cryptosporangium phraense]
MYDYLLGGTDNFAADRAAVEQLVAAFPSIRDLARENRKFLVRAVRHLAAERGIDQFLDIGAGLPTSPNIHEIAPAARVVYVDRDPLVLRYGRERRATYVGADLRDPDSLRAATDLLDLTRPVALSLVAILHFLPDSAGPLGVVHQLMDALPSGSALVLSHSTEDVNGEEVRRAGEVYTRQGIEVRFRSAAEVLRFFDGLDLLDPGLVPLHAWRPDGPPDSDPPTGMYAAVGVKLGA